MCKKIPRKELIKEIERLADEIGKTPTSTIMKNKGKYSITPYIKEFEKWSNAVKETGREPVIDYNKNSTKEDIINEIKRLSNEYHNGDKPSLSTLNQYSNYTRTDIKNNFNNWGEAVEKSGFRVKNKQIKDTNLIYKELHKVKDIVGRVPRRVDFDKHSSISSSYVSKEYDGWLDALAKNGMEPNEYQCKQIDKKHFIKDFKRIVEEEGRVIKIQEYRNLGNYSDSTIRKRFGCWGNFIRECGFEPLGMPKGEDHYNWNGGWEGYYGPSWPSQRKKARLRDQMRCQICLSGEHEIGRKPDVHHIKPTYKFNIEKEHRIMNNLNNLISLCSKCHHSKDIDGRWQNDSPMDFAEKAKAYLEIGPTI